MRKQQTSCFKSNILVVDDTPANLQLLTEMLTLNGYKVRVLPNSELTFNAVKSNPPDLILLDILMPELDGYAVCQLLKSDQTTARIPVIFISALQEDFDKVKAFEVGGVDYITKPFQIQEVLARVENQLRLKAQEKLLIEQNAQLQQEIAERQRLEEKLIRSEASLKQAQKVAQVGSWEFDIPTQTITGSQEMFRILGLDGVAPELTVQQHKELIHPDDRPLWQKTIAQAESDGKPYQLDFRIVLKSGEIRHLEARGEGILNGQQHVIKLFGTMLDITQRKQAEILLAGQNQILAAIASDTPLKTVLGDLAKLVEQQSGQMRCSFLLLDENNRLRLGAAPSLPDSYNQAVDGILIGPKVGSCGTAAYRKEMVIVADIATDPLWEDVKELPLAYGLRACWSVPILATDGTVLGTFAGYYDRPQTVREADQNLIAQTLYLAKIAIERQRSQTTLRQNKQRLQLALEGSALGLWDWNIATGETYFDALWKKMLGYEEHEIENNYQSWLRLLHPDEIPTILDTLNRYLQGESLIYEMEIRMLSKSGEWKWILGRGKICEWDEVGKPLRMAGTHRDITERKQAEQTLKESEKRYRELFEGSMDGIVITDLQGRILDSNASYQKMLGYSLAELQSLTYQEFTPSQYYEWETQIVLEQILKRGYSDLYEKEYIRKDGTVFPIEVTAYRHNTDQGEPDRMWGVIRDITARKQAEEALKISQARFSGILEIANDAIISVDIHQRITLFNQGAEKIFGYSAQEVLGQPLDILLPERCVIPHQQHIANFSSFEGKARRMGERQEIFGRCKDGREFPAEASISKLEINGEQIFTVILRDMTVRKQAEEALRESIQREKALAKAIERMRQTLDVETIFSATTQELRQVLNCDRVVVYRFNADWSGMFVCESVVTGWLPVLEHPESQPAFSANFVEDPRCCLQDLKGCPELISDTYMQETEGGIYSQGVAYQVAEDIYTADFELCYITLLEQLQARAYIIVPIFCGTQLWGLLGAYQNSNPRHWSQAEINVSVQISNHLGVALQQAQILQQAQTQSAALQQAVLAADAANRAKSQFLANMSHELRTPLNAILGFTQIMSRNRSLSKEYQNNLNIINRAGEHLLNLINDILEVSKIEAGCITFNENSFDLLNLLEDLENVLRFKAESKGLILKREYSSDLPQWITTDEGKLRQVLLNLLGNAIKFTPQGTVTLRVFRRQETEDRKGQRAESRGQKEKKELIQNPVSNIQNPSVNCQLSFEIEDTGVGIAPEEMNLLFEAFAQTDAGRKSSQGTGLGLVISRQYVQMMGGDIDVRSTPGLGSIFRFDISIAIAENEPVKTVENPQTIIALAPRQPEYRILIVDDLPESRLLMSQLLTLIGFSVQEAENGVQAIARWETWQPHLIFMDMRMPVMDGYQATQHIKARMSSTQVCQYSSPESPSFSSPQTQTVIIALTASAFEEERHKILCVGCDDLICKPFKESILLEKIRQYLGVEYIYEQESILHPEQIKPIKPLTEKDLLNFLSKMPKEWITKVHEAASECNDDQVLQLLKLIPPEYIELATALESFTHDFDFEKIINLTQREQGTGNRQ